MRRRIRWILLPSVLLLFLFNLALSAPTAWAHQHIQRDFAPPGTSSPVATVDLRETITTQYGTTGYDLPEHFTVTNTSSLAGKYLFTGVVYSSHGPDANGDLPDINAATGGPGVAGQTCKVGSTGTGPMPGGTFTYTVEACPESQANPGTLDWNKDVKLPLSDGGTWAQAKIFVGAQYPSPSTLTATDWLQMRLGESKAIQLPVQQVTGTPVA